MFKPGIHKKSRKSNRPPAAPAPLGWLVPACVVGITLAAFLPALWNEFVDWDDFGNLVDNPNYRGLGWPQLVWMFTAFHWGHYQPLTWITFALDYLAWGMDPFGYHLTNVLFHSANAAIFYFVARRLLSLSFSLPHERGADDGLNIAAGFTALVFALHPLRVESVAWATERRDLVSGLFFLATILCYLKAAENHAAPSSRPHWYAAALISYGLSLLAKASGMVLPLVLLIIDVFPLRRIAGGWQACLGRASRGVLIEKIPFFVMAIVFAVVAVFAQRQAGAMESFANHGFAARLAQAFYGTAFYLWKTLFPVGLSPLYELPEKLDPWGWPFVLSALIFVLMSAVLILVRVRWPAGLAVWVSYLVVVAPVLGLAQSGPQLVADRYSYLSCLGWALLAGGAVLYGWRQWQQKSITSKTFALGAAIGALMILGMTSLTWSQINVWRDSEQLWRRAVAHSDASYFKSKFAHLHLGKEMARQSNMQEAQRHYERAVQIDPKDWKARDRLAGALMSLNRFDEAIEQYREGLKIAPSLLSAHLNIGNILVRQGKLAEGIEQYRLALSVDPDFAPAYFNMGNAQVRQGKLKEAEENYRLSLQFDPGQIDAYANLAGVLVRTGRLEEATEHLEQAIKINPGSYKTYLNLGKVKAARGNLPGAVDNFRQAIRLQPDFAEAHESLARALAEQGRTDEAKGHYQEALRLLNAQQAVQGGPNR